MSYIYRNSQKRIIELYSSPTKNKAGMIVSGIVGCGKTTLIEHCLEKLSSKYEILQFSGDDAAFRRSILENTRSIFELVSSKTSRPALVFVDEIQKCEEVFDAVKYAYDREISFIVSGSNPAYLRSVAKKRLQRRAEFLELQPLCLSEIFFHQNENLNKHMNTVEHLIEGSLKPDQIPHFKITLSEKNEETIKRFLVLGGLPLAFLEKSEKKSLEEIRKVVERGFELMAVENNMLTETVKAELATLHSREFTYQNIMKKTGIKKRDVIDSVLNDLMNHGYLVHKKPVFPKEARRSYLSVFSYIDPGIATYLSGELDISQTRGLRIEGSVHARLHTVVEEQALKTTLGYFKNYSVDKNNTVKFLGGEIDFVIQQGNKFIPIEVKSGIKQSQFDLTNIKDFIKQYDSPFGLVLYGGLPYWDKEESLLFFPYWLV